MSLNTKKLAKLDKPLNYYIIFIYLIDLIQSIIH